jgi:hypothetical protein
VTNLATAAEVLDATGKSVSAADITRAQSVIATVTGRDLDVDPLPNYRARDLRLLKSAVVWQTAYLDDNPDVLVQLGNVQRASTNGNTVEYAAGGASGSLVAPLAEMSLRRLSWRRSRSIRMRRPPDRPAPQTIIHDGADGEWRPLR